MHVAHAHKGRGYSLGDGRNILRRHEAQWCRKAWRRFALIERGMLKGPWVMGEAYTICDAYLFTVATWLEGDGMSTLPRTLSKAHDGSPREADVGTGQRWLPRQLRSRPSTDQGAVAAID